MRVHTAGERALLAGSHLNIHGRVDIKDTDSVWRDTTNLSGVNFFDSVRWGGSIDEPVLSGSCTLHRAQGNLSLAPFMAGSPLNRNAANAYAPLLNAGRSIRVYSAVMAAGVAPSASDWRMMLDGKVDSVDIATDSALELGFRDNGARLLDTQIEVIRTYGATGGTSVEGEIQRILTDNSTSITLYTPASPGWQIQLYDQDYTSVMDAIRTLALQIGWDIRYVWHEPTQAFRLTFYEPQRTKTIADATFTPAEHFDVTALSISDADIRNVGTIDYLDSVSGLVVKLPAVIHAGSIAEFGRRAFHIPQQANIDTPSEATDMITAAVTDLALPEADHEIETMYFWPVEMGDLYAHTANAVDYDSTQDYAVVQYQHTIENGGGRTTLRTRGKPAGAYRTWLNISGVTTVGVPFGTPQPVFSVVAEAGMLGQTVYGALWLRIEWDLYTDSVRVQFAESPTSPVPNPPSATLHESAVITRPEGDLPQVNPWIMYHRIPMTPLFYGRVLAQGFADDGKFGTLYSAEIQAADTGTAPVGGPASLAVAPVGTTNRITFTVGDGAAEHLIYRDQIVVYVVPAGTYSTGATATVDDTNITSGVVHDYDVVALRSGQTPNPVTNNGNTGGGSNQSNAPAWQTIYPVGAGTGASAVVRLYWTCADAAATNVDVEISTDGSHWGLLRIEAKNPPSYIADAQYPEGADKFFRLKARGGSGLYSTTRTARYGTSQLA